MATETYRPYDNWDNRVIRMRCSTCRYFVPKDLYIMPIASQEDAGGAPVPDDDWWPRGEPIMPGPVPPKPPEPDSGNALGRCRRHAPKLKGWPVVFATDWCGDHKLDENKI